LSHFELKPGGAEKAVVSKEIKEYLDVKELSSLIGMPMNTIYKLTVNGKIPFTKIGQRIYFKRSKLDRWLEKQERGL